MTKPIAGQMTGTVTYVGPDIVKCVLYICELCVVKCCIR